MPKERRSFKVKLVRSLICCTPRQRQTVCGLGLRKIGDVRSVVDTAPARGQVAAVAHLVKVVE